MKDIGRHNITKAKKRARMWAMFDWFENEIPDGDIEKQTQKYIEEANKTEKNFGFNPLTGKIRKS